MRGYTLTWPTPSAAACPSVRPQEASVCPGVAHMRSQETSSPEATAAATRSSGARRVMEAAQLDQLGVLQALDANGKPRGPGTSKAL